MRLREIKERADKASAGPWELQDLRHGDTSKDPWYQIGWLDKGGSSWGPIAELKYLAAPEEKQYADGEFIAHARTDVPELVAEVERLQVIVERLMEWQT